MVGSPSADLKGMAMPAQMVGILADHTYVESSCGYRWGCFGRDIGGTTILTTGMGNSNISECLSFPRETSKWVYAGLIYKTHGLCHQAANRILHPSNQTVHNARGYWVSRARYKDYGLRSWRTLDRCYSVGKLAPRSSSVVGRLRSQLAGIGSAIIRPIMKPQGGPPMSSNHEEAIRGIRLMLGKFPVGKFDEQLVRSLAEVQAKSWEAQEQLVQALEAKSLDPEEFQMRANEEHKRVLEQMHGLLGASVFDGIFGEAGHRPERIAPTEPTWEQE